MRKISSLLLLAALFLSNVAPTIAQGANAAVTVSYIDCAKNIGLQSHPWLSVSDYAGTVVMRRQWPERPYTLVRQFELALRPGFFTVGIRNGECVTAFEVTVLPNHPRFVAAIGSPLAAFSNPTAMLSGTLPSNGWRVAIVYPDRVPTPGLNTNSRGQLEIPAIVEGNAYYATALPPGRVVIRLYNQERNGWIDVDGGVIDLTPGKGRSALLHNVTLGELHAALKQNSFFPR